MYDEVIQKFIQESGVEVPEGLDTRVVEAATLMCLGRVFSRLVGYHVIHAYLADLIVELLCEIISEGMGGEAVPRGARLALTGKVLKIMREG